MANALVVSQIASSCQNYIDAMLMDPSPPYHPIYLTSGTYLFLVPEIWDSDGWIHEFNSRPQHW
jgi:hypothetical protein